jgi:hypothetical protein
MRKKPGSLTLLALNLHPNEPATVRWPAASDTSAQVYRVTAPDLTSSQAFLNGSPMRATEDFPISLEPSHVRLSGTIELAPASYAFVVAQADAPSCM